MFIQPFLRVYVRTVRRKKSSLLRAFSRVGLCPFDLSGGSFVRQADPKTVMINETVACFKNYA